MTASVREEERFLDKLAHEFVADSAAEARKMAPPLTASTWTTRPALLPAGPTLIEKNGDLFAEPGVTHLAHCISADCKLGAGIAKTFVAKFGPSSFRQRIAATSPAVGSVAVLEVERGLVVYNLVTKQHYWQKPTLAALVECLIAMRNHAVTHGVRRIAMPRIGCGLDQLKWDVVRESIEHVFARSGVQILVVELAAAEQRATTIGDLKRYADAATPVPPTSSPPKRARTEATLAGAGAPTE